MIPRSCAILALLLPLAALAQPVHFDVTCLPREQQEEARAKAKAIMDEAQGKRRAAAGATAPDSFSQAMATRDVKQAALNECGAAAKKANRSPLEVCAREFQEMREAAFRVDRIFDVTLNPERPIDQAEKKQLEALRAQYPSCDGPNTRRS